MKYPKPSQRPDTFKIDSSHFLNNGLVFANLGQHTGSLLYYNSTSSKNHGALTGYTGAGDLPIDRWQWDSYIKRFSLSFDGSNDNVPLNITGPSGSVSVCFWASPTTTSGTMYLISDYNSTGSVCNIGTLLNSSLWKINWGDNLITSSSTAPVADWQFVGWTRKGSSGSWSGDFCVNGSSGSYTSSVNPNGTTGVATLGRTGSFSGSYYSGKMADVMIWDRAIQKEVLIELSDPSNYDLRINSKPLIIPIRRFWPVMTQSSPQATLVNVPAGYCIYNIGY